MTPSQHAEDRFSELFDGTLEAGERDTVRAHLGACAACREGYGAFERSTRALRTLRVAPASAAHVRDVQAAIASTRKRRIAWPVLSHAAAVLLGLSLAWGLRGSAREVRVEVPVEVVREVPVEVPVPVEVVREVVREVPVERIVERIVERPVEHTVYVDRPVPNPLQLDVERGTRILATMGDALAELARLSTARAASPHASPGAPEPEASGITAVPPAERTDSDDEARRVSAPVRIVRDGDQVRIRTLGTLDDVVPALIDTLNDPDDAIARAAEQHLEALRAELSGNAALAPLGHEEARDENDRPGGLRGLLASGRGTEEQPAAPDAHTRWTSWWLVQSRSIADAGSH